MKKFLLTFSVLVLIIALLAFFIPLSEAADIYNGILRLHILANSDSAEDQNLKLKVRDVVLEEMKVLLADCNDLEDAEKIINDNIEKINSLAKDAVISDGYEYNVTTTLTIEYYPEKEYEDLTLPSGEYRSLRVIIGEGSGQNWWCVLYPPVCTGSASVKEELAETGFTTNQIKLITDPDNEKYTVKFKFVEFFSDLKYKVKKLFS